ncbi:MAG: glycosyltransferase family 9 protein [Candidatus Omnitrophota bacterium]|nr:glycosyltransferase family 9 protein [Candidatus Omnitrophota bacterium]MDZ4243253.1 glycosyltransferase family 9 protein [Candidatus Omnitrophota bacterium]
MSFHPENIKKILMVSLTNIGDIILTFPVLDILLRDFPEARLSMIVGPKGEFLLKGHPRLHKLYIYNKHQPGLVTLKWMGELRRERFDLAVDLRNSAIPFLAGARYRTSLLLARDKTEHMLRQHLRRLMSVYPFESESKDRLALHIPDGERKPVDEILRAEAPAGRPLAVLSPGAADHKKRWREEGFAAVARALERDHGMTVVFVGDGNDRETVQGIRQMLKGRTVDLSGRISLLQLGYLFSLCRMAVVNDSAPLHMASYLGVPVVALFGPTDPARYGPWGRVHEVVRSGGEDVRLIPDQAVLDAIARVNGRMA